MRGVQSSPTSLTRDARKAELSRITQARVQTSLVFSASLASETEENLAILKRIQQAHIDMLMQEVPGSWEVRDIWELQYIRAPRLCMVVQDFLQQQYG